MSATWQFASDNTAGVCPEAMEAWLDANRGNLPSYGNDGITRDACDRLRDWFETDCDVYFVFSGTAANSLALATLCQSYQSIICHSNAHIETDECGAPEFFSNGSKLWLAGGAHGKLDPVEVASLLTHRKDLHYPQPRGLSISQSTELGTVYRIDELAELGELARRHHLKVHMDGARFANALAFHGVRPAELSWKAGVDVLCFGGTKLGMAVTEAVVFFDRALGREFAYRCKQAGQLCSKMRFISAQWLRMLEDDTILRYARHANHCAARLAEGLAAVTGVRILQPVEANAVFCQMPSSIEARLRAEGWQYYDFIAGGGCRFMCSWNTRMDDVEALLAAVRRGG